MKKLFVTLLTLLSCGTLCALPLMNPSEPSLLREGLFCEGHYGDLCDPCLTWCDALSVRLGFYGDYVFNRYLQLAGGNNSKIDFSEIYTNAGLITVNFWDRVDIFGTLGATSLYFSGDSKNLGADVGTDRYEIYGNESFSWSVGTRATLWECGCTTLGAQFQWFCTHQKVRSVIEDGSVTFNITSTQTKVCYHDWQLGFGLSHRINILVPYIGLTFGNADVMFEGTNNGFFDISSAYQLSPFESYKNVGYAVGVSLVDCEKMSLTAEVDLARETAAFVSGQLRF